VVHNLIHISGLLLAADSIINNVPAGTYLVAISDNNGCITAASADVNSAGGASVSIISIVNVTCDNPNGGSIDINVYGGKTPYSYLWSTGDTTQDIFNLSDTTYQVTVTDDNGCVASKSFVISFVTPSVPICIVTVDSATGKNLVVWEKPDTANIQSYNIYKEESLSGIYHLISSVLYDSLSTFLDTLADPQQRSWRYKISVIDSCGNESELSQVHKTMYLAANLDVNGKINLNWDHYSGFSFSTYTIFRGTSPFSLDSINAIPGNTNLFSDVSPPQGQLDRKSVV